MDAHICATLVQEAQQVRYRALTSIDGFGGERKGACTKYMKQPSGKQMLLCYPLRSALRSLRSVRGLTMHALNIQKYFYPTFRGHSRDRETDD